MKTKSKFRFSIHHQEGLSLIEVLISTAILGILIISTLELFTFFNDQARSLESLQVENIDNKSVEKLRDRVNQNNKRQLNRDTFCTNQNLSFVIKNNCSYDQAQVSISNNFDNETDTLSLNTQNIAGLDGIQLQTTFNPNTGTLTTSSTPALSADDWEKVLKHVRFSEANQAPARSITSLTFSLISQGRCNIDAIEKQLDLTVLRKYCSN